MRAPLLKIQVRPRVGRSRNSLPCLSRARPASRAMTSRERSRRGISAGCFELPLRAVDQVHRPESPLRQRASRRLLHKEHRRARTHAKADIENVGRGREDGAARSGWLLGDVGVCSGPKARDKEESLLGSFFFSFKLSKRL